MTSENTITLDMDATVGFVGAGRLGTSVAAGLHRAEINVVAVSSRSLASAESLAERVPGCAPVPTSQDVADIADVVFITTGDAEITLVAQEIAWREGQGVIHCSGARPLSDLAAAHDSGARIGGLHPLQTFPTPDSADLIPGASAAVGSEDPGLLDWLQKVVYVLEAKPFTIKEEHRAVYHASAVMA
ncbi:MAG: NAD(P)-binding domain-containing protein, partial [Chloroflexi bacterium]|nr:NAD(P)-binding domain-containing protein [Chloroflexota bacterium]